MKVPVRNKAGGMGWARFLALLVLLVCPGTASSLTPSGSVISHDFTARYATPVQRDVRSNQTRVNVKDLADPLLVPPRTLTARAGEPADFRHTLTNRGNFADTFRLRVSPDAALAGSAAAPALRFYAADGETPIPAGADGVQQLGPVEPGGSVDLVLRAVPPPGSEGRVVVMEVAAASVQVPGRSASLVDRLVVPAPGGVAALKTVSPAGDVLPGAELGYGIEISNSGAAAVAGVRIVDPLDPMLEYRQESARLPAGIEGSVSFDAATRSLVVEIASLPAGYSGVIAFRARVSAAAPGNASIVNTALVSVGAGGAPTPTNSTVNTVVARALQVTKVAGKSVAEAGDVVSYSVRVENLGAAPLQHVILADRLPRGFRYLKGSSRVDGVTVADPVGGGEQVSWDLGTMEPDAAKLLEYRVVLSAEVPEGTSVNWAKAEGTTVTGSRSVSAPVGAAVKVRPSLLGSKAIIMGRVFRDGNGNGVPDSGEPGEVGVRIYLEDGSFVFTDPEGKYSFTGVSAGDHVVKVDRGTLDPGWEPVPYNTAFAGVGWSQFVTVPFGGPARGDFALRPRGPAGQTGQTPSDWLLVGLGAATVGAKTVSGDTGRIGGDDRFDEGIFHEERLAFFTRGSLLERYLLTAAYDSDKERRDGVFQAIDPEKYYPVYGDASDIGYEAQSRGKLYLKLESGPSYLMAGDYRTDLSENEFSRYDRALNGVKFELNGAGATLEGFESRTEETLKRDDIPGNGTSGHYFLSFSPVFENSERVRIEVRDRYHSERVVSVTEKIRYVDYSIDYRAGTILFKQPVPSLDQYLNPVVIVVTYQASGTGDKRYVYGGRGLFRSPNGSYLGATAVVEQHAGRDDTLLGADAGWLVGDWLSLKGEGAVSENLERGRGSAFKTELALRPLDTLDLGLYYRNVEADFFNSSMAASELGTKKYGGRLEYRAPARTLLSAESFVHDYELSGRKLTGHHAGLARKFSLFQAQGGVKLLREELDARTEHADLVYAGVAAPLGERLDATLRREQLLSASGIAEYQTKTFAKLDYRLSERTKAFLTEEYQEGSPLVRHATLFGLESRLSDRMRLTSGYRTSGGVAGYTQQSSVELNTRLLEGERLTLDSRSGYQLEHALSQQRGQAILGLNGRYRVSQGLFLDSSLERVQTVEGNGGTRTAFAVGAEYLRPADLKLSGRYEVRSGPGESASLYGARAAYKMNPSLTLLGKLSLWDRDADAGDDLIFDGYLGSAFRPLQSPLHLLTLARLKMERRGSIIGAADSRSVILSAEPTYRLVRQLTLQGKYAGKVSWGDGAGDRWDTYTDLVLAGLSYDPAERWELALYLKLMNQYDAGMHSLGAVGSAGYRVYRNVVLSAGYNLARVDDRDLTGETYQGQGPFVGIKVKFDEDLFHSAQSVMVPAPPVAPVPAVEPPKASPVPVLEPALLVRARTVYQPLQVSGSAELFTLLVNGERARLPSTAVSITRERLGSLDLRGGRLAAPVSFLPVVEEREEVGSWTVSLSDGGGKVLQRIAGTGPPPERIDWQGGTDGRALREGEIYQYQLQVVYRDGSVFRTGPELFGVNRSEALLLTLSGGAFVFDKSYLTEEAKRLLRSAARVIRAHPAEKVILEGHTDGIGSVPYNMALSRRRCDAAVQFLVREEGVAPARLVRRWYGKSRPVADNVTTPGRRLNRRVEVKGDFGERVPVGPDDRYRTAPFVTVNGVSLEVDRHGRFDAAIAGETDRLAVEMGDSQGRFLATTLPLPGLAIDDPAPETLVHYGSAARGIAVDADGKGSCILSGRLQGADYLELGGERVELDREGRFAVHLPLAPGERVLGMVLKNGEGCARLVNLRLNAGPARRREL